MKAIKSYQQFVNEARQTGLIYTILDALEPTVLTMVNEVEAWFIKKFERPFSDFDREMTRLQVIADLVKSIEYYTEPTDTLISITPSTSRKGNIEIFAQIQRETETYNLRTEAIIAGGYNIQKAHYRYLTSTKLPRTGRSEISKEYTEKIKKMTKAEKLNYEIENLERDITRVKKRLAENSPMTDAQIEQELIDTQYHAYRDKPTWAELIKRDAAKNYNNSEEEYNAEIAKNKAGGIKYWKYENIIEPTNRLKYLEKEIIKLKGKLEQVIASI
jgi:hypothetical protein